MNNWISITEQLPTLYEPVLFCFYVEGCGFGDVKFGWYEGMKTVNAIAMLTSDDWYPCTHWMELPIVPEVP